MLAPRAKVKQHSWIKDAAKAAGVPIYTIKTTSPTNLVRGLRTVVGLDPSPGSTFASRHGDAESAAADAGINGFAVPLEVPESDPEAVPGWEGEPLLLVSLCWHALACAAPMIFLCFPLACCVK